MKIIIVCIILIVVLFSGVFLCSTKLLGSLVENVLVTAGNYRTESTASVPRQGCTGHGLVSCVKIQLQMQVGTKSELLK